MNMVSNFIIYLSFAIVTILKIEYVQAGKRKWCDVPFNFDELKKTLTDKKICGNDTEHTCGLTIGNFFVTNINDKAEDPTCENEPMTDPKDPKLYCFCVIRLKKVGAFHTRTKTEWQFWKNDGSDELHARWSKPQSDYSKCSDINGEVTSTSTAKPTTTSTSLASS